MKILIACEFSGIVRSAFSALGHNAWSCDLLDTEIPGPHIKGDVLSILNDNWDLMIAHPPCFSGETLVLTRNGYKCIADLVIGEEVLTHLGRWRKITKTMNRQVENTVVLKITGSTPIITTTEHPFLVKTRSWKNINGTNIKVERGPYWKNAGDLNTKDLVGSILPPEEIYQLPYDDEHLWLMGCYVADGYLRYRNNKFEQVAFAIGNNKASEFETIIKNRKITRYDIKSVSKFVMYGKDFCDTFSQFGRSCYTKEIPGWVLSLPANKAKIFLDGYLFGDGCKWHKSIGSCSVSKKLTLGISILMRRVYNQPITISVNNRKPTTIIEGRTVNQNTSYGCRITIQPEKIISSIEKDYTWYPFRTKVVGGACRVYNISVEQDESYIVDNCIVHNCTYITNAGVRHLHKEIVSKNGKRAAVYGEARWQAMYESCEFFNKLKDAPIPRICIENPIPHKYARELIGKYSQIIQPWQFGHGETKATCLWLKNLPLLQSTNIVSGREQRIHKMPPGPNRWKERSRTFTGIANAMATQWNNL